jgi:hypothetical protein
MPVAAQSDAKPKMKIKTLSPVSSPVGSAGVRQNSAIRWNPELAANAGTRSDVFNSGRDDLAEQSTIDDTSLPLPSRAEKPTARAPLVMPPAARPETKAKHVETTIVMPDDAPESATQAIPTTLIKEHPARKDPAIRSETSATDITVETIEEPMVPPAQAPQPLTVAAPESANLSANVPAHIIEGFGEDMPLAIALQQLAPPGFSFSFGDNVNPGTRVSWEGHGQSWDSVMKNMLAPLGLEAVMRGQSVMIRHPRHSAAVIPATPAIEMAAHMPAASKVDAPAVPEQAAEDLLRRKNLRDPGETEKLQPFSQSAENVVSDTGAAHDAATTGPMIIEIIEPAAGSENTAKPADARNAPAAQISEPSVADQSPPALSSVNSKDEAAETFIDKALAAVGVNTVDTGSDTSKNVKTGAVPVQPETAASTNADVITSDTTIHTKSNTNNDATKAKAEQALAALDQATAVSEATRIEQPAPQTGKPALGAKQFFVTPGQWTAQNGQSLKDVLERWGKEAGITVAWEAAHDFTLSGAIKVEDTFQGAVQTLMDKGLGDGVKPSVTFQIPAERGQPGILLVRDSMRG